MLVKLTEVSAMMEIRGLVFGALWSPYLANLQAIFAQLEHIVRQAATLGFQMQRGKC